MSCPTNQCKLTNYISTSDVTIAEGDILFTDGKKEVLPTLVGKPERITALNENIKEVKRKRKGDIKLSFITDFTEPYILYFNKGTTEIDGDIIEDVTESLFKKMPQGLQMASETLCITGAELGESGLVNITGDITIKINTEEASLD